MLISDVAITPFQKIAVLWPFILIGLIIAAAIAVSVILIVKLAKRKKKE